jgi:hypothetical protein
MHRALSSGAKIFKKDLYSILRAYRSLCQSTVVQLESAPLYSVAKHSHWISVDTIEAMNRRTNGKACRSTPYDYSSQKSWIEGKHEAGRLHMILYRIMHVYTRLSSDLPRAKMCTLSSHYIFQTNLLLSLLSYDYRVARGSKNECYRS